MLSRGSARASSGARHGATHRLRQFRCPFECRQGGEDRRIPPCGDPSDRYRRLRPALPRSPRGRDARRCGRRPDPLLRRRHRRHDRAGGDRPGGGDRRDRSSPRRLAPCRCCLGRNGRDLPGAPPEDRRRGRTRRQLGDQPAQVDARQLRLPLPLDRLPAFSRKRPDDEARLPPDGRRRCRGRGRLQRLAGATRPPVPGPEAVDGAADDRGGSPPAAGP